MEQYDSRYYPIGQLSDASLFLIRTAVGRFLQTYRVFSWPVDCFELISSMSCFGEIDLKLLSSPDLSPDFGAVASYLPEINAYTIITRPVPDDWKSRSSGRRVNFTLAHELGHIFLGHLALPDKLKSRETRIRENLEADEFAGRLLMPEKLLLRSARTSRSELSRAFLVSESACYIRLSNLKRLDLLTVPDRDVCPKCGNSQLDPDENYCPICGTDLAKSGRSGSYSVIYPSVLSDETRRAVVCPHCGCTEYADEGRTRFACGFTAYNQCWNHLYGQPPCGHINPVNARRCERCGNALPYSGSDILPPWEHERREYFRSLTREDYRPLHLYEETFPEEVPDTLPF